MKRLILKPEIIDAIRKDPLLYGKLGYILEVTPMSIPRMLAANSKRLTEASILKLLKDHLQITSDEDLLMEVTEVSTSA